MFWFREATRASPTCEIVVHQVGVNSGQNLASFSLVWVVYIPPIRFTTQWSFPRLCHGDSQTTLIPPRAPTLLALGWNDEVGNPVISSGAYQGAGEKSFPLVGIQDKTLVNQNHTCAGTPYGLQQPKLYTGSLKRMAPVQDVIVYCRSKEFFIKL